MKLAATQKVKTIKGSKSQQGAALLMMVLVIVLAFASLLLSKMTNRLSANATHNNQILSRSHESLIGYALANTTKGQLPCPDLDGDGIAESSCGSGANSRIGYLPWQTLGLGMLLDSSNSCLWYAVSGNFKSGNTTTPTQATQGQFVIYDARGTIVHGQTQAQQAIAVIIAPQKALADQNRTSTINQHCKDVSNGSLVDHARSYLDEAHNIRNYSGQRSGAAASNPGYSSLPTVNTSTFIQTNGIDTTGNDILMPILPADFSKVNAMLSP